MATERLRYIIEAEFRGQGETAKAEAAIRRVEGTASKAAAGTTRNWKQMAVGVAAAGAAFGVVAVGASKAYEMMKEGAALELARTRFDNLTASINSSSDAMLGRLREATSGMIRDAELIASANDLIRLKLVQTEDEVVELAYLIATLGWDMQTVIQVFAQNSELRLDSLGLALEDVREKARALEQQGYDMDRAFDLAVMQAGREQVELMGDAAVTGAGKIARLETQWHNLMDSMKVGLATVLLPVIDALNHITSVENPTQAAFAAGPATIGTGYGFQAWMNANMAAGNYIPGDYQTQQAWYRDAVMEQRGAYQIASRDANRVAALQVTPSSTPMFDYTRVPQGTAANITGANSDMRALQGIADAALYAAEGERILAEQTESAGGAFRGSFTPAVDDAAQAIRALAVESGDLFSRMRSGGEFNLAEEIFKIGDELGFSARELADVGVAGGLFSQDEATRWMNQVFQVQRARELAMSGLRGQELLDAATQETPDDLVAEFFSGLDQAEVELGLDTDPALATYDSLKTQLANDPLYVDVIALVPSLADIKGKLEGNGGAVSGGDNDRPAAPSGVSES